MQKQRRKQLSQQKQQQQQQKKMKRDRATIGLSAEEKRRMRNKSSSLSRPIRSHHSNKVAFTSRSQMQQQQQVSEQQLRSGGDLSSLSMLSRMKNYPGLMMMTNEANETGNPQQQPPQPLVVNLNPDLCYQVGGLTAAQKKLCVQNTSIMPAISRGARAAIQVSYFGQFVECQRTLSIKLR